MEKYIIIREETELLNFVEKLPDLQDGQKYYVSLFARKKYGYTEGLKSDKSQLKRFTCRKEDILSKLKKLEVELGLYTSGGIPINQNSLAVYITPNPRDMHRAGLKTAKEIITMVERGDKIYNPQAIALNQIQVSGDRKFFDVDVDFLPGRGCSLERLLTDLQGNINPGAIFGVVVTRGGFHVLVSLEHISDEYKKSWYNKISNMSCENYEVTMNGDNMMPIPGCVQSDFVPKFVTYPLID